MASCQLSKGGLLKQISKSGRVEGGDDVEDPRTDYWVFGLFLRNRWVKIEGYNVDYRPILRRRERRA
jgi:hypothetical protein